MLHVVLEVAFIEDAWTTDQKTIAMHHTICSMPYQQRTILQKLHPQVIC